MGLLTKEEGKHERYGVPAHPDDLGWEGSREALQRCGMEWSDRIDSFVGVSRVNDEFLQYMNCKDLILLLQQV